MSNPTTYEILIAEKLQELAVPDQATAIWEKIEQHLNIEMPIGSSPGGAGGGYFNWWMGGTGLFSLLVGLTAYLIVTNQKIDKGRSIHSTPVLIKPGILPSVSHEAANINWPGLKSTKVLQSADPQSVQIDQKVSSQAAAADSLAYIPVEEALEPITITPSIIDTAIVKKKPRGVRGISDADYRIVPARKDSMGPGG